MILNVKTIIRLDKDHVGSGMATKFIPKGYTKMTQHAILFLNQLGTYSLFIGQGEKLINVNFDLESLCEFTLEHQLTHLWVHQSMGIRFTKVDYQKLIDAGYDIPANWQFSSEAPHDIDNYLISLHGYKKFERGRTPRFNLIFLEYASFGWQEHSPERVLGLIHGIEDKLGVAVGGSPAGVGMRYLQKCNEKHPAWLAKPTKDLSTIPFTKAARPLIWSRQPSEEELTRRYLYKFDRNSDFPRVAVDERFGVGDPVHCTDGREFDHMLPGIWKVDMKVLPYQHPLLPAPLWANCEWLATPLVRFLVSQGCGIHVNEAWVFPKYEYIFRNWGNNLYRFTQEYDRGTPERAAFKQIMNDPLGLVRSDKFGTDSFKYRPDWNTTIVAGSRANVLRKVYKYALEGYYPVMVRTDAIYYLSNEKEPNLALPGILDHAQSLGGYKMEWCLEVNDQVRSALEMSGNNRLSTLNALAEQAGF